MRFTEAEYQAYVAKQSKEYQEKCRAHCEKVERESTLHNQILAECDRRLWGYIHSRMDRRTTTRKGVCDFVILADGGRTFLIEAKMPGKKFSPEQLKFEAVARRNGHCVHRVETFDEFLKIIG